MFYTTLGYDVRSIKESRKSVQKLARLWIFDRGNMAEKQKTHRKPQAHHLLLWVSQGFASYWEALTQTVFFKTAEKSMLVPPPPRLPRRV